MVRNFLKTLLTDEYKEMLVHHEVISESEPEYRQPEPKLNASIVEALRKAGVERLYTHQTRALEIIRAGKNPVSITPTASGKTLSYNIPIIEDFLNRDGGHALYLFPLKALEQDQLKQLNALTSNLPQPNRFRAEIYDGDTPPDVRAKIRADFPRFLLTNPEMLHLAVANYHRGWIKFLKGLKFIVIDELHTYKGIFGSHMAQLFRRLDRICRHYGSHPRYIASSATISNPVELAENLTGKPFVLIEESGAPASKRHYVFMNPEISVYTIASRLFRLGLELGLKTIVFTKARKITELIYQWVLEAEPELKGWISAYRAGFLPEERREIERKLHQEELLGVISTSALEMGVDIGSLDLCILVGYPGSISATFQRGGRVGRKAESTVVLLAQQNALDQYFMSKPRDFFERSFEAAVVDRENRHILKKHIICAAAEIPITPKDSVYNPVKYTDILSELVSEGALQQSADGKRWFAVDTHPHRNVDLRASGAIYTITESSGQIIGSISGGNAFSECHPGAIYLHKGRQYLVSGLDLQIRNVSVKSTDVPYYTTANSQKDTEIISRRTSKPMVNFTLHLGELKVTEWITGYEKRRLFTQESMGTFPLDLPEQSYRTVGLWMEIPRAAREWCESEGMHFMGGIHGIEHILLSLVPLFALCDRRDMGGISLVEHAGVKGPAVFLYDGYPGGVGLAERIYEIFDRLLERTLKLVSTCPCENGCPSCIHSPRCGSGNYPLDKKAVIALLEKFTGQGGFSIRYIPHTPEKAPKTVKEVEPRGIKEKVEENNRDSRKIQPIETIEPPEPAVVTEKELKETLFFDLETQLSSDDVGGWGNIKDMRLAVGVTLDLKTRKYRIYYEEDAAELVKALEMANIVVGFNLHRFDYTVLQPYGLVDPSKIRTLDMLKEIERVLGHRLSLDAVCSATLGAKKSADGLQSVAWFKKGRLDLVTAYCQKDVELTRDLYLFGKENGYILYEHRKRGLTRIPVRW